MRLLITLGGPVSCENGDPPKWGSRVPILLGKWGPGSLYSREYGDPGPYIPGSMGTRVPIFPGYGDPGPYIPGSMGTRVPIFLGKWGPPWKNGNPLYGRPFSNGDFVYKTSA